MDQGNTYHQSDLAYSSRHVGAGSDGEMLGVVIDMRWYHSCAELERLRNIVDAYAVSARTIALYLQSFCDSSLPYADMIADASRKASERIAETEKGNAVLKRALKMAEDMLAKMTPFKSKGGWHDRIMERAREEMEK